MAISENPFLKQLQTSQNIEAPQDSTTQQNPFLGQLKGKQFEPRESFAKSGVRTLAQPLLGLAKRVTWPADVFQMIGTGEALSELDELEERIPELKKKFPSAPWENFKGIDREKYMQAVEAAASLVPTQENAEKLIEEALGIPLRPKTGTQKALRLAGTAAGFRPGGLAEKGTAAVVAPTTTKILEKAGLPEPIAETVGLVTSGAAPSPSISKVTKPSGLSARRFEGVTKPTKISAPRHEKITESVEKDFKKIADQLLEKNKTYSAMKEDSLFKEKIGDLFEKVESLAEEIPETASTSDLRESFRSRAKERTGKGISPNEFERSYRKEYRQISKELPYGKFPAQKAVDQFRKNNQSLGELFEPGKSSAANRAKKEALLDYNRSIEDVIKKTYPDSEFKKLFEFTNKRWKEINDLESIQEFMDNIFKGKINYKEAKKLFSDKKGYVSKPFKDSLGEQRFKDFKTLVEDLLSTEKGYSMLKKAEQAGFSDLVKYGTPYLISPKLGALHTFSSAARKGMQMTLGNPKIAIKWKNALDNLKRDSFKQAEEDFKELDELVNKSS